MDGSVRLLAPFVHLAALGLTLSGAAVAADSRLPRDLPSYISPYLEDRFAGAMSVSMKLDGSDAAKTRKAELTLRSVNPSSDEGAGELQSRVVPLLFELNAARGGNDPKNPPNSEPRVFQVRHLPVGLLRGGETLRLILLPPSDDHKRFAPAIVRGRRKAFSSNQFDADRALRACRPGFGQRPRRSASRLISRPRTMAAGLSGSTIESAARRSRS